MGALAAAEPRLFSEMALRDVTLRNRIVVSPMWQYCGKDGFPTDWHLMNLGRYADGGAGLVFQEGTTVHPNGRGSLGDLGLWDDKYVPALERIVQLVTSCGAVPGIQLMHAGRKARCYPPFEGRGPMQRRDDIADWDDWHPVAPSPVPLKTGLEPPREMTTAEVVEMVDAFASAARRARQAGYEVMDLHAAHGYLLHEFLSPAVNLRGDRYGGPFENRIRFLAEVVEAVRGEWDAGRPLFVRLSCIDDAGWEIEDTVALARVLKGLGVDVIDCSSGGLVGSPLPVGAVPDYGYQVAYSAHVRREADIATMTVGLIVHAQHADRIVSSGEADLVALGRELLYNPSWPLDAAQKLGLFTDFSCVQRPTAFWLSSRAKSKPDLIPSTFAGPTPT